MNVQPRGTPGTRARPNSPRTIHTARPGVSPKTPRHSRAGRMHRCEVAVVIPRLDFGAQMRSEAIAYGANQWPLRYRSSIANRKAPRRARASPNDRRRCAASDIRARNATYQCRLRLRNPDRFVLLFQKRPAAPPQSRPQRSSLAPRISGPKPRRDRGDGYPDSPRTSQRPARYTRATPNGTTAASDSPPISRHDTFGFFWMMMPMDVAAKPKIASLKCGSGLYGGTSM